MQTNDMNSPVVEPNLVVNDLGPLAWVLDELRKSLDGAAKALKRFVREAEAAKGSDLATLDASHLRIARQQLHQAVGALEMVGLGGPALVLRAMEAAVQKFVQQPEQCSQESASKIEKASFALTEYLEAVLAGRPISAVSLFPQYRDVQELVRADRIHPADLWPHEWRWLQPDISAQVEPRSYDSEARTTFDNCVLQIMKSQCLPAAENLKALSLSFAARHDDIHARIFWKIAAAYFEALLHGLLPLDMYVRRAAARILIQYSSLSKGDAGISDRLAHDLLFFCAQADAAPAATAPVLAAVKKAYGLARFKPVDYTAIQFGRFDPALLAQARKRIITAKETWSSLSAGDATKFKVVGDQFALVADSLVKLHPDSEPLALALNRAIDVTARSGQTPAIELAMEVATSVLYLEAAFDDLDPNDPLLGVRTKHLAERLENVKNGAAAQPLESWMEELYRRVSDKQTMGSVVGELRVTLGELEKSLDNFFRNPKDKKVLLSVPGQLAQMRGVLSVLGLDQASQAVMRMRTSVEQMLETEIDEELARAAGTFDQLGNNLGALSFLIDMLNYQPTLAKKLFVYDDDKGELRPLMGRAEKVQAEVSAVSERSVETSELLAEVQGLASYGGPKLVDESDMLAIQIKTPQRADSTKIAKDATFDRIGQIPEAIGLAPGSLVAAVAPAAVLTANASIVVVPVAPAAPLLLAATPQEEDFDEDDLRDIFLEEAREVVGNGQEAIGFLAKQPGDINQQTVLRRVFHTLKGSARMVGLNEFGDAGWAMEQLFNSWLADQKPASEQLLTLSGNSLTAFSSWIEDIASSKDQAWSASPFRASALAMRDENVLLPLTLPEVAGLTFDPPQVLLSDPSLKSRPESQPEVTREKQASIERFFAAPQTTQVDLPETDLTLPELALEAPVVNLLTDDLNAVSASVPQADNIATDFYIDLDFFGTDNEITVPAVLDDPMLLAPSIEVTELLQPFETIGIDFDSLSALSGAPETSFGLDAATAEMLEIEALQNKLESFELQTTQVAISDHDGLDFLAEVPVDVSSVVPASVASSFVEVAEVVDLTEAEFVAQFVSQSAVATSVAAVTMSDDDASGDDQVRIIGDLRIGIQLYNVYLNEADEWSRRLLAELSEWAIEHKQTIPDSTVSFAHSLAGSSATVGFISLSDMARALEHALLQAQTHYNVTAAAGYANLFVAAAEDVRRLLHQFAAGFLKTADAHLIAKLRGLDFSAHDAQTNGSASLETETTDLCAEDFLSDEVLPPAPSVVRAFLEQDFTAAPAALTAVEPVSTPDSSARPPAEISRLAEQAASFVPGGGLAVGVAAAFEVVKAAAESMPAASVVAKQAPQAKTLDETDLDNEIDATDAIDAELFPIFDEEATELMPQLGSALRQWSGQPANLGLRMEVLRVLHTLKGSARLAGALRLGEMAHRIESEIEFLGTDAAATQDFEPLLTRFDGMQHTLDVLRSLGAINEAEDLTLPALSEKPTVQAAAEADVASHKSVQPEQLTHPDPADEAVRLPDNVAPSQAEAPTQLTPGKSLIPAPQTMAMQPLRQAASASIRVRSQLLDRMVNQAGEVMITRSRLEVELNQLRGSLSDMNDNLNRLRQHLRDIELQAETQMQSRLAQAKELQAGFDPLEFDRFTRVQELTRMMAESVNDVATVQRTLQRTVEATEDDLIAQARQTRELQRDLLRTRMVEFEGISDRLYRVVRQASKETGKQVKLDLLGGTIEMDRGMLDRMTPAFEHLLRNCVAHGIESPDVRSALGKDAAGLITVHLRQEGNDVSVEFSDDGSGLDLKRIREKAINSGLLAADQEIDDQQAADLIFMPGFTTAVQVTELAGRGIGMDVVRTEVNSVGGRIETTSVVGKGTQFKLVLPLTTAVTQVVMIRSGALSIGVPANVVEVVRRISSKDLHQAYNAGTIDMAGEPVPFFWSGALLQASRQSAEVQGKTSSVVVFRSAAQRIAMHVDEVLGNQEVVVKNLGPQLVRLPGLAGMSVLASGAVVLIYNPVALASVYGEQARALSADNAEPHILESSNGDTGQAAELAPVVAQIPLVMVVDDSITVRRVTQRLLQRAGYRVVMAADGLQALERLQDELPSVVLSDIEMPRMDGFDLARNIRGDARLKHLPIVMITSRIAEKHRDYAKELGVNHYLGKPYPEDELMSLVKHYCSQEVEA